MRWYSWAALLLAFDLAVIFAWLYFTTGDCYSNSPTWRCGILFDFPYWIVILLTTVALIAVLIVGPVRAWRSRRRH